MPATVPQYTLTANVDGDHGQVQPTTGKYYAGTLVPVTATPDKGYRVAAWTGTDDDASHSAKNLVVLWSDRAVTVKFDQPKTITVTSNGDYTSIQRAIDAAHRATSSWCRRAPTARSGRVCQTHAHDQ